MTKSDMISQIAQRVGVTNKVAGEVLNVFVGLINQTLKEEGEIRIDKLGTFKVVERKARPGFNPKTGANISISARKALTFRASQALKDTVKES